MSVNLTNFFNFPCKNRGGGGNLLKVIFQNNLGEDFHMKKMRTILGTTLIILLALNTGLIGQTTQTFTYTGSNQTLEVPSGVTSMTFKIWGAGGAGGTYGNDGGGSGGYTEATMTVTPGETLIIAVGGGGLHGTRSYGAGGSGGWPGGGYGTRGDASGGGGGGYSGVFRGSHTHANSFVIAGGGGAGTGYKVGGAGGGSTGNKPSYGGYGGTQSAGGTGTNGDDGSALQGGNGDSGGSQSSGSLDGGGGGGGYYGGEGGYSDAGGGGGGSGYVNASYVVGSDTLITGNNGTGSAGGAAPNNSDPAYQAGVGVGSNNSTDAGDGLVYAEWTVSTPMAYSSSTTETATTDNVYLSATENQIVRLNVVTTGAASPFDVTSVSFNTNGTTNTSDITNAKVFYTTGATFSNASQFGSTVASPSGSLVITGTQTLASGNNYFWLTYDIPAGATVSNVIDGECNSVTVDGDAKTPTAQAPAGTRTITEPITSTTTETASTADVNQDSNNNEIIRLKIVNAADNGDVNTTSITFNTTGSTSVSDITNAKVYYTTNTTFSTSTQFGSTVSSPSGSFTVTGTQALANGNNYFWLAYDISASATIGNVVDGQCTSNTSAGNVKTPDETNPSGSRSIIVANPSASAPSGSGTSGDPYLISNLAELSYLCQNLSDTNYWASGVYIKQTADINASSTQYWDDADDNDDGDKYNDPNDATSTGNNEGFSPIGNASDYYYGQYDGNNKTLANIYMDRSGTVLGIFGKISNASITDLTVSNANISLTLTDHFGAILVANCFRSTIDNVNVSGGELSVIGASYGTVGAFAGYIYGATVQNSTTSASVVYEGTGLGIGGFVGTVFETGTPWHLILNCSVSGNVTITGAAARFGGFAGTLSGSGGSTSQCYANNNISAPDANTGGGFVGYHSSPTYNCYSTSNVSGDFWVGGFVGALYGNTYNCYSTGQPTGNSNIGGFCGLLNGGSSSNCFWDTETSEQSSSSSGTGKTTAEMKNVATFTDESWSDGLTTAGDATVWDFETNPNDDVADNDYWDIDGTNSINNGYPYLSWQDGEDVSLPVELTSFTADNSRAGEITLNWVTESEIENLGFILERRQASGGSSQAEWTEIASYITDEALRGQGSVTYRTEYSFTDKTVEPGVTYDYRLADVSYAGEKVYHALNVLGVAVTEIPEEFALFPAYPNPFNPETVIRYQLSADSDVSLQIYDLKGQMIETLLNKTQDPGFYKVNWKPNNLPSGVYFCKLTIGDRASTQKLILLK